MSSALLGGEQVGRSSLVERGVWSRPVGSGTENAVGECQSQGGRDLLDKEAEGEKGSKSTYRLWIAELDEV